MAYANSVGVYVDISLTCFQVSRLGTVGAPLISKGTWMRRAVDLGSPTTTADAEVSLRSGEHSLLSSTNSSRSCPQLRLPASAALRMIPGAVCEDRLGHTACTRRAEAVVLGDSSLRRR